MKKKQTQNQQQNNVSVGDIVLQYKTRLLGLLPKKVEAGVVVKGVEGLKLVVINEKEVSIKDLPEDTKDMTVLTPKKPYSKFEQDKFTKTVGGKAVSTLKDNKNNVVDTIKALSNEVRGNTFELDDDLKTNKYYKTR